MLHAMLRAAARVFYAQEVLADSPVAYWRLGESSGTTAVDEVGSNDGTYVNSPTLGVTGALAGDTDTAVAFNGSTERVIAGSVTTTPETFEVWFKPTAEITTATGVQCVFSPGSGSGVDGIYFGKITGSISGELITVVSNFPGATSQHAWTPSGGETLTSDWHHLAVVWTGTTYKFYLDGVERTPTATSYPPVLYDASNVWIGARSYNAGAGSVSFDGTLDEVAIYDFALSAARIEAHYNAGTS